RTLWNIISSCGLTVFACTWTAIHPDIPRMRERVVVTILRRLVLMDVAFIYPENITTSAASQFLDAYAFPGWTLTHGFFACMGGFMLYVDGRPRATLTPDGLLRFVREGSVDMPIITEADIEDRSKADVLTKCITLLQLVQFVIQLIARYAQGLMVTPLEVATLCIVVLICIAYGLWWKKPKDVGCPYIVHWNSGASTPPPPHCIVNKYVIVINILGRTCSDLPVF
ncbi:hypothetical protein BDR03DRAFT_1075944, partial [Suillus americanus]